MKSQHLTCPADSVGDYIRYMRSRKIKFSMYVYDKAIWFRIDAKLRPHKWKL